MANEYDYKSLVAEGNLIVDLAVNRQIDALRQYREQRTAEMQQQQTEVTGIPKFERKYYTPVDTSETMLPAVAPTPDSHTMTQFREGISNVGHTITSTLSQTGLFGNPVQAVKATANLAYDIATGKVRTLPDVVNAIAPAPTKREREIAQKINDISGLSYFDRRTQEFTDPSLTKERQDFVNSLHTKTQGKNEFESAWITLKEYVKHPARVKDGVVQTVPALVAAALSRNPTAMMIALEGIGAREEVYAKALEHGYNPEDPLVNAQANQAALAAGLITWLGGRFSKSDYDNLTASLAKGKTIQQVIGDIGVEIGEETALTAYTNAYANSASRLPLSHDMGIAIGESIATTGGLIGATTGIGKAKNLVGDYGNHAIDHILQKVGKNPQPSENTPTNATNATNSTETPNATAPAPFDITKLQEPTNKYKEFTWKNGKGKSYYLPVTEARQNQLVSLKNTNLWGGSSTNYHVHQDLVPVLTQMAEDAKKEGVTLNVVSGFRSVASQDAIIKSKNADYFKNAPAGYSEHHSGLAVDFNSVSAKPNAQAKQAFAWLEKNAHKYGMVQTYKGDRAKSRGMQEEAWHYAYVGKNGEYAHLLGYDIAPSQSNGNNNNNINTQQSSSNYAHHNQVTKNPKVGLQVGIMGDYNAGGVRNSQTGAGTGDHFDITVQGKNKGANPNNYADRFMVANGDTLIERMKSLPLSDGQKYGAKRNYGGHRGIDIDARSGRELYINPKYQVTNIVHGKSPVNNRKKGYGNYVDITFSDGIVMRVAHMDDAGANNLKQLYGNVSQNQANNTQATNAQTNTAPAFNGELKAVKVVSAGEGKPTVLQMNDGSIISMDGARNWRNYNSGNLMYTDFARKHGAIGSDGRFAIFPDKKTGDKAREALMFESNTYKDLSLRRAIERYAPPMENNTDMYYNAVLKAVGTSKKMSSYNQNERKLILDAMEKIEGFKEGKTTVVQQGNTPPTQAPASTATTTETNQEEPVALPESLEEGIKRRLAESVDTNQNTQASEDIIYGMITALNDDDPQKANEHISMLEKEGKVSKELADNFRKLLPIKQQIKGSDTAQVNSQIVNGKKGASVLETNLGINQYHNILSNAVTNNDLHTKERYLALLNNFNDSHQQKSEALQQALTISLDTGKSVFVAYHKEKGYTPVSKEEYDTVEAGNRYHIHKGSARLVNTIAQEAQDIKSLTDFWNSANDTKHITIPQVSSPPTVTPTPITTTTTATPDTQIPNQRPVRVGSVDDLQDNEVFIGRAKINGKTVSMPLEASKVTQPFIGMYGNAFNSKEPKSKYYSPAQDMQDNYNKLLASHYINNDVYYNDMENRVKNATLVKGYDGKIIEEGINTVLNSAVGNSQEEKRQAVANAFEIPLPKATSRSRKKENNTQEAQDNDTSVAQENTQDNNPQSEAKQELIEESPSKEQEVKHEATEQETKPEAKPKSLGSLDKLLQPEQVDDKHHKKIYPILQDAKIELGDKEATELVEHKTSVSAIAKNKSEQEDESLLPVTIQNIITTSFKQNAQSNIAKYPDLIQQLIQSGMGVLKQLGITTIQDNEQKALEHFIVFREQFKNHLTTTYKQKNTNFSFQDFKSYLNISDRDNPQFDESVITALASATYDYLYVNAGSKFNTNEYIASTFFGMPKDTFIPHYIAKDYRDIGVSYHEVSNGIGQEAVRLLGLKAVDTAPIETQSRLIASLGVWAVESLEMAGLGEKVSTPFSQIQQDIATITNAKLDEASLDKHKTINTFVFENKQEKDYINGLIDINKGTSNFVANLLGIESFKRYPLLEKPKQIKHKIDKTKALAGNQQEENVNQFEQEPIVINQDMYRVVSGLKEQDNEFLEDLFGATKPSEEEVNKLHISKRDGEVDKAVSAKRDLDNFFEWVGILGDVTKPFYDRVNLAVNTRMHNRSNVVNFQSSLQHRAMAEFASFKVDIDISQIGKKWVDDKGSPLPHTLLLRAIFENAEGTEKLFEDESLPVGYTQDKLHVDNFADTAWNYLTTDSQVAKAVSAINELQQGKTLSQAQKRDIKTLVDKWEMGANSLRALVETANLLNAYHNKQTSITTSLGLGSDGINNGTAIGMILMGIDDEQTLNRVGIFRKNGKYDNYQDARKDKSIGDYYLGLQPVLQEVIANSSSDELDTIQALTPSMNKRKVLKDMLIPFGYSAGIMRITQVVFERMLSDIATQMEKIVADNDTKALKDLEKHLQVMIGDDFTLPDIDNLLKFEFKGKVYKNLQETFYSTMYGVVETSIYTYAPEMVNRRAANIGIHSHTANLYLAVYQATLKKAQQEKADEVRKRYASLSKKEIEVRVKYHTLSKKEIKEKVDDVLAKVFPKTHTSHSAVFGGDASIEYVESTNTLVQDDFTQPTLYQYDADSNQLRSISPSAILKAKKLIDTGLRPNSQMIQSLDAFVSAMAMIADGVVSINVHDANIANLLHYLKMSATQNKAFFLATAQYHMFSQSYTSYVDSIVNGYTVMGKAFMDEQLKNVKGHLISNMQKHIDYDLDKIELLLDYQNIHQYGGDGGRYQLSKEDIALLEEQKQVIIQTKQELTDKLLKLGFVETQAELPKVTANELTNHSGGASGADSLWDSVGRQLGVVNHIHYRPENSKVSRELFDNKVKPTVVTQEQLNQAKKGYEQYGVTLPNNVNDLVLRNWFQVNNAQSVVAIAPINTKKDRVTGGTGYAVKLGIAQNKPVYVWDTNTQKWYSYNSLLERFDPSDTPRLTKDFAGVGTRDISNEPKRKGDKTNPDYLGDDIRNKAIQAIKDVYENSIISQEEIVNNTVDIWFGTGENKELSNLALRPFVSSLDNRLYQSVEHFYQSNKTGKFDEAVYNKDWKDGSTHNKGKGVVDKSQSEQLMKTAIKESFVQNESALQSLLATGNKTLTHSKDKGYWKEAFPRLLMQVRQELANQIEVNNTQMGIREGLDKLSAEVVSIDTQGLDFKDTKQLADEILKQLQGLNTLTNQDTGWQLSIGKKDRQKMGDNKNLSHATSQAVQGIKELTHKAVLVETHQDTKHNNPDVKAVHRFYVPALIDGQLHRVKLTVKDYQFTTGQVGKKALHAIEAVEIENALLGTLPSYSASDDVQTAQPTTGHKLSVTDLLQGVKQDGGDGYIIPPQVYSPDSQNNSSIKPASIDKQAQVLQGKPVGVIDETTLQITNFKHSTVTKWANELFKSQGNKATNPVLGEIVLNERSVKDSIAHGLNPYKAMAFVAVKDALEQGVLIAKNSNNQEDSFYISAPIRINDLDNILTVLVHRDVNTQRMYLHSINLTENLLTERVPKPQHKVGEQNGSTQSAGNQSSKHTGMLTSTDIHNILQKALTYKLPTQETDEIKTYLSGLTEVDKDKLRGILQDTTGKDKPSLQDAIDYVQQHGIDKVQAKLADNPRLQELKQTIPEDIQFELDERVDKFVELYKQAKPLQEVLEQLDLSNVDNHTKQLLNEMTKQVQEHNPTVRIVLGKTSHAHNQGEYHKNSNVIYINETLKNNPNELVATVIHEMAHAITAVNLDSPQFAKEKAILTTASQKVANALQKDNELSARDRHILEYAVSSPHELLAVAMSDNKTVQSFIIKHAKFANIKEAKGYVANTLNALADLFKNLLGLSTKGFKIYQDLVSNIIHNTPIDPSNQNDSNTHDEYIRLSVRDQVDNIFGMRQYVNEQMSHKEVFKALDKGIISDSHNQKLDNLIDKFIDTTKPSKVANTTLIDTLGLSDKEAFTAEVLYEMFTYYLDKHSGSPVANGLAKLHINAQKQFASAKDMFSDYDSLSKEEQQQRQKLHQKLFNDKNKNSLAWFMALASSSEQVSQALSNHQLKPQKQLQASWFDKMMATLEGILHWFNDKVFKTDSTNMDTALSSLLANLHHIDSRARNNLLDNFESGYQKLHNYVHRKLDNTLKDSTIKLLLKLPKESKHKYLTTIRDIGVIMAQFDSERLLKEDSKYMDKLLKELGIDATTAQGKSIDDLIKLFNEKTGKNLRNTLIRDTINELTNFGSRGKLLDKLVRITQYLGQQRQRVYSATLDTLKDSFETKLSKAQKTAISKVLLKTDVSALLTHGMKVKEALAMLDDTKRKQAIARYEQELKELIQDKDYANDMLHQTKSLGLYMAKEEVADYLVKSAEGIAIGLGYTDSVPSFDYLNQEVFRLVDILSTLQALNYVEKSQLNLVNDLLNTEQKGIQETILLHQKLVEKGKEDFKDNPYNYQKGYLPEINHPNRKVVWVDTDEVEAYIAQGFELVNELAQDELDSTDKRIMLIHKDYAPNRYVSGALDMIDTHARGTPVYIQGRDDNEISRVTKAKYLQRQQRAKLSNYDPTQSVGAMIVTYDAQGAILNYHYEMTGNTRDSLLERNNDFDELLARQNAQLEFKPQMKAQQKQVAQALIKDAKANAYKHPNEFVWLDFESVDEDVQRVIAMLPNAFRQEMLNAFGHGKPIPIHKSAYTAVFGFRAYSIVNEFDRPKDQMTVASKLFVGLMKVLFKENARKRSLQIEQAVQEMMKLIKDVIVIRSGGVLLGNIMSNMLLLSMHGINPLRILMDSTYAWRNAKNYKTMVNKIAQLDSKILTTRNTQEISKLKRQRKTLQDNLDKNPLKDFMEAGLLSTIVEDLDTKDNPHKADWQKKMEGYLEKIPPQIRQTVSELTLHKGSTGHDFLSEATQFSDFAAKYVLAKHLQTNGMATQEAIYEAQINFINFDMPTNKFLDYMNQMGFMMFTKFFLRFQQTLIKMAYKAPVTSGLQHLLVEELGGQGLYDPSIFSRLGNPFDESILMGIDASDEVLTALW